MTQVDGDWSLPKMRKNTAATFADVATSSRGGNFAFLVKRAANAES